MSVGKAVAILIWLLVPAGVLTPRSTGDLQSLPALPWAIVLLPVVFFAVSAFWGGYWFDVPRLRRWVDRKRGDGTYASFIRDLKPMLLFAVLTITSAASSCFQAYRVGVPVHAYAGLGFMISSGLGFLIARSVLARRGLLMESRSPSAARVYQRSVSPTQYRSDGTNR